MANHSESTSPKISFMQAVQALVVNPGVRWGLALAATPVAAVAGFVAGTYQDFSSISGELTAQRADITTLQGAVEAIPVLSSAIAKFEGKFYVEIEVVKAKLDTLLTVTQPRR